MWKAECWRENSALEFYSPWSVSYKKTLVPPQSWGWACFAIPTEAKPPIVYGVVSGQLPGNGGIPSKLYTALSVFSQCTAWAVDQGQPYCSLFQCADPRRLMKRGVVVPSEPGMSTGATHSEPSRRVQSRA